MCAASAFRTVEAPSSAATTLSNPFDFRSTNSRGERTRSNITCCTRVKSSMYADRVLDQLHHWSNQQQLIRAVILTSSRAIPHAALDLFSDYDVILVLRSIQPLFVDRSWLEVFGPVLAVYRDPLIDDGGQQRSAYVVQYENGLKIDFNLWPVELLQRVTRNEHLPAEFDAGYKILVDKDHLTTGLKP